MQTFRQGGGGACQSDPEISVGGAISKKNFLALRALVWSKNKCVCVCVCVARWGAAPWGPSPGAVTENGDISSGLAYRSEPLSPNGDEHQFSPNSMCIRCQENWLRELIK